MPSILWVKVHEGRGLPVMDRSSRLADAYVEIRFKRQEQRTKVCRKSLDPVWDEQFEFRVTDDEQLLTEALQLDVMDKDTISYDDAVGSVLVSLKPLVQGIPVIQGWFPLYDTLEGMRGELYVTVKLVLLGAPSEEQYVRLFAVPRLSPAVFPYQFFCGLVSELVVEDDPEYGFGDNFRTARKSNQSRQLLLHRLSNTLASLVSSKVRALGGNAVLGYQQHFDVEGDSGIVGRAYGTAFRIVHQRERGAVDVLLGRLAPTPSPLRSPGLRRQSMGHVSDMPALSLPGSGRARSRAQSVDGSSPPPVSPSVSPAGLPPPHPEPPAALDAAPSSAAGLPPRASSAVLAAASSLPVAAPEPPAATLPAAAPDSGAGGSADAGAAAGTGVGVGVGAGAAAGAGVRAVNPSISTGAAAGGGVPALPPSVVAGAGVASSLRSSLPFVGHTLTPRTTRRMAEAVQLLTVTVLPTDVKVKLGGLVAVRSVKYLGKLHTKAYDQEKRDMCEQVYIHDDVCVLSVMGTAARLRNPAAYTRPVRRWTTAPRASVLHRSVSSPTGPARPRVPPPLTATVSSAAPPFADAHATPASPPPTRVQPHHPPLPMRSISDGGVPGYTTPPPASTPASVPAGDGAVAATSQLASKPGPSSPLSVLGLLETRTGGSEQSPASAASAPAPTSRLTLASVPPSSGSHARHSQSQHTIPSSRRATPSFTPQSPLGLPTVSKHPVQRVCSFLHLPKAHRAPFHAMRVAQCQVCKHAYVPEVLLATIDLPRRLPVTGPGEMIEARVARRTERSSGEVACVHMSEELVFLEYELHQQFMLKLKVCGRNTVFGLRSSIVFREDVVVATMSGTAMYADPLPPPTFAIRTLSSLSARAAWAGRSKAGGTGAAGATGATGGGGGAGAGVGAGAGAGVDGAAAAPSAPPRSGVPAGKGATAAAASAAGDCAATGASGAASVASGDGREDVAVGGYGLTEDPVTRAVLDNIDAVAKFNASTVRMFSHKPSSGRHSSTSRPRRGTHDAPEPGRPHRMESMGSTVSSTSSDSSGDEGRTSSSGNGKRPWVFELQAVEGADVRALLLDRRPPPGITFSTLQRPQGVVHGTTDSLQMVTVMARERWRDVDGTDDSSAALSRRATELYESVFTDLCYKVRHYAPCTVCAIKTQLNLPLPDTLELLVTGMVVRERLPASLASGVSTDTSARAMEELLARTPPQFVPQLLPRHVVAVVQATARAYFTRLAHADETVTPHSLGPRTSSNLSANPFMGAVAGAGTGTAFSSTHGLFAVRLDSGHSDSASRRPRDPALLSRAVSASAASPQAGATAATSPPSKSPGRTDATNGRGSRFTARAVTALGASPPAAVARGLPMPRSLSLRARRSRADSGPATMATARMFAPDNAHVVFTPQDHVAGHVVKRYCGWVNLLFIRESVAVRQGGGLSSFFLVLLSEANAVTRAHVAALGGNAILGYRLTPLESGQQTRNQAYHMVSVSGDAVWLETTASTDA